MSDRKNIKKIFCLIIGGILYISMLILGFSICSAYNSGLLLLYTPFIVIVSSSIVVVFWFYFYKNIFETFIIWLMYIFLGFSYLIMAPLAIDRSLSTFIFFYTVQNGSIQEDKISQKYIDDFIKKRFDDAVKGNFLKKEGEIYTPQFRAKLYYYIMYPLGNITNTLDNYKYFEKDIKNNSK